MPLSSFVSRYAIIAALSFSSAAMAQEITPNIEPQRTANELIGPDTYALRYFAKLDDKESYKKELKRLRIQYPGFYVDPSTLMNADQQDDDMWKLFASGDFDALRTQVKAKQALDPYWRLDPDLERQLGMVDKRDELRAAFERNDFTAVVDIVSNNKSILSSNHVDVISAIGVALIHQDSLDAAISAFDYGVRTGMDHDLIAVLIQRAARFLPVSDAYRLLRTSLSRSDLEKEKYLTSFHRGMLIRINDNKFHIPPNHVEGAEAFGVRALAEKNWFDVQLLAWAYYIQGSYERAYYWFEKTPEQFDDGKVLEGKVLSLKMMERIKEAVKIADKWKDEYDELALLYINLTAPELLYPQAKKLSRDFLTSYADLTRKYESGEGSEALGWYAYNVRQSEAADAWFDKALDWRPTETAAFGKTLVAAQINNEELFNDLKIKYGDEYPRIAELKYRKKYTGQRRSQSRRVTVVNDLARAHKNGQYKTCVAKSDRLIALRKSSPNDYQIRGWCLLKLNRPTEANLAFMKATSGSKTTKERDNSSYGAALAALKQGHTNDVVEILRVNNMTAQQRRTVQKALWAQQALAAFNTRRFRDVLRLLNQRAQLETEPRNLTELRGWSFYNLGDYRSAHSTFSYMDQVVSTRTSRDGLRAAEAKIRGNG